MPRQSPIKRNHRSRWTLDELRFVEAQYRNVPTQEIAAVLGRSINGVRRVVSLLGLTKELPGPWTEEEIARLHAHYDRGNGIAEVHALLPGRSREAIQAQASRMGITGRDHWSASENRFLRKHYGTLPTKEIATTLGRSVSAVRMAVNTLGLMKKQMRSWTQQDIDVLRAHYADGAGLAHVQTLLPHRSRSAITVQASKMGITRSRSWHPDEEHILREFYPVIGSKVVEKLPGRSIPAIKGRVIELGLRYRKRKPREIPLKPWTDEEWRLLASNLAVRIPKLLPLFPGRTRQALENGKKRLRARQKAKK